jgi:putative peptide zinc metalloprotease protein
LLLWVNIEPGVIREICFAAFIVGSVSTLMFNGNPLLRFDGYYILSDALEIPNLAARSRRYLAYLIQRYVLRMRDTRSPVVTASERPWFVIYGVLSSVYRLIIMTAIVWFVARQVPLVGLALGGWVILSQLLLPALRGIANLVARAAAARIPRRCSDASQAPAWPQRSSSSRCRFQPGAAPRASSGWRRTRKSKRRLTALSNSRWSHTPTASTSISR